MFKVMADYDSLTSFRTIPMFKVMADYDSLTSFRTMSIFIALAGSIVFADQCSPGVLGPPVALFTVQLSR